MQQRARLKALERFRADDTAVLVASDVAARGLDIPVSLCASLAAPIMQDINCSPQTQASGVKQCHDVSNHLLYGKLRCDEAIPVWLVHVSNGSPSAPTCQGSSVICMYDAHESSVCFP